MKNPNQGKKWWLILWVFMLIPLANQASTGSESLIKVSKPLIVMSGTESAITINIDNDTITLLTATVNEKVFHLKKTDGKFSIPIEIKDFTRYTIHTSYGTTQIDIDPIPLWFSIIPPLIAILAALLLKEVFSALVLGLLFGVSTIYFYFGNNVLQAVGIGFFAIITDYILRALNDSSHLSIILFSLMIGGMVQIITRNGGMNGIVYYLSKYARSRKSGQFITWLLGVAIFFDDYANTLVVGTTMRPVTDKLKISREKLAYIVDSTAAPVASIALITTWIGAQLSYIQQGIDKLQIGESAYMIFLNSIPYAFYPVFTLIFILILIYTGRDFGPMLKAEQLIINNTAPLDNNRGVTVENAQNTAKTGKAFNALVPVLTVVLGTITGLLITGFQGVEWSDDLSFTRNLSQVIGASDSFKALLWSSFLGSFVAIILSISQKILSLKDTMESMVEGFKLMLPAILILTLAWALAALTEHLHTAQFITGILIEMQVSPLYLPAITFVLASIISFSTGSSWGTMAILYPLILPASWLLSQNAGFDYHESLALFHNVVSVVLAGSVFGDHCSPISDTTIMSSLSSQCNHIQHVNTQLAYALVVGLISLIVGTIPTAFGFPVWLSFLLGILVSYGIIRYFGRKVLS